MDFEIYECRGAWAIRCGATISCGLGLAAAVRHASELARQSFEEAGVPARVRLVCPELETTLLTHGQSVPAAMAERAVRALAFAGAAP